MTIAIVVDSSCAITPKLAEEFHLRLAPLHLMWDKIIASGDCPLVIGNDTLIRVNVHTLTPDDVLEYARSKGTLTDIVIEDMDQQVRQRNKEK